MPQEQVIYPFPDTVKEQAKDMTKGNFGLWYNKFIPVKTHEDKKDAFKTCDASGKVPEVVEFYEARYKLMQKETAVMLKRLLGKKHQDQSGYCGSFSESDYKVITIRASLKTPLITGIGELHPHEVSMVFDHNLGIPYIPAAGVKGIVRFAHTLSIFLDETGKVKEEYQNQDSIEESITDIPDIFGGIKAKGKEKDVLRGRAVFLDAYPENVTDLHIDIMNPHYADYYGDPRKQTPPADYLSPNPLKFLTVAPGAVYVFRAIARKESDIPRKVKEALSTALTEEGVGAKTALGYGRFTIDEKASPATAAQKCITKKIEQTPLERCCTPFKTIKPSEAGKIGPLIDMALKTLTTEADKRAFAQYVKEFLGNDFKKSKAREKLKVFLA